MTARLGRYRLLKLLATGGMGEVFLAVQEGPAGFSKTVVVKRILRHLANDQSFIDLFLNEAKVAAQLQHPNITQVFGLEHEANAWFISMEYVHGRSLRDLITAARAKGLVIPPRIAARLASQALQALHYAHELTDAKGRPLGILHRDVSPENVLVAFSGVAKLVDFGLVKAAGSATARVGRPRGKLAYMAPELTVAGAEIDRRADVYSVGVLLVEAVTLAPPNNTPQTVAAAQGPRAPWKPEPTIPAGLAAIISRALAIDTQRRFSSAAEMADALEGWIASSAEPVVPGDIAVLLEALFGQASLEQNAGVNLGTDQLLNTGVHSRKLGTEPLTVRSDPRFAQPNGSPASTRSTLGWPIAGGLITVLVVGFVLVMALAPRPTSPPAPTPSLVVRTPVAVLPASADAGQDALADAAVAALGNAPDASTPLVVIAPFEVELEVDAGAPRPVVTGKRGKVVMKLPPGVEVLLEGERLGTTPMAPVTVNAGLRHFTLRAKSGVERRVSLRVPNGGRVTLKASFSRR